MLSLSIACVTAALAELRINNRAKQAASCTSASPACAVIIGRIERSPLVDVNVKSAFDSFPEEMRPSAVQPTAAISTLTAPCVDIANKTAGITPAVPHVTRLESALLHRPDDVMVEIASQTAAPTSGLDIAEVQVDTSDSSFARLTGRLDVRTQSHSATADAMLARDAAACSSKGCELNSVNVCVPVLESSTETMTESMGEILVNWGGGIHVERNGEIT